MIECKKVSFSYPPNETDIGDREGHGTLRNIDLSINDGDFVLLTKKYQYGVPECISVPGYDP